MLRRRLGSLSTEGSVALTSTSFILFHYYYRYCYCPYGLLSASSAEPGLCQLERLCFILFYYIFLPKT